MGQGHPQGFGDDLGGRCGAKKLAASTGRATGAAGGLGSGLEINFAVCEAGSHGLDLGEVFSFLGEKGHPARDQDAGKLASPGEGHHHGWESFVAGGHAHDSLRGGQGAGESSEDNCGIIAIGQRIEHPGRPLGAAIAGVTAEGREWNPTLLLEDRGGLLHEEGDFPVPGVQAKCGGSAIRLTDAAGGGEHEKLRASEGGRVPAHAGVLGPAEDVPAGGVAQEGAGEGERSGRSRGGGANREDFRIAGI